MKKLSLWMLAVSMLAVALGLYAGLQGHAAGEAEPVQQALSLEALEAIGENGMSLNAALTCKVVRPVHYCNYDLCEQNGCGAPVYYDKVDCACHCGYAF